MQANVAASGDTIRLFFRAFSSVSSWNSFMYQRRLQPCPGIDAYWFFWNEKTTSVRIGSIRNTKPRIR